MNSIVIGSGFGGIAAALRLKAKGHKVKLIEKHPDLGGRARVFKRNGFIYDAGPTVITAPYLINELFELFNKDPKNYIELTPLKIWYQFIFEDKTKFNYSGDEREMKDQIEKLSKEDVNGYEKLVNFTKKIFEKGFLELADVPFDKPFVMMQQLPALLKLKSYKSVYSLVSSYIKNEKLRRMLSMYPLLVGGNPFTTTSIYGLILYLEKKWGIHYSVGGTGNIIKGFEKLMNEVGIEILKKSEVTEIITKNNKISGVKLNNENETEIIHHDEEQEVQKNTQIQEENQEQDQIITETAWQSILVFCLPLNFAPVWVRMLLHVPLFFPSNAESSSEHVVCV